jgi:hypothetical protein
MKIAEFWIPWGLPGNINTLLADFVDTEVTELPQKINNAKYQICKWDENTRTDLTETGCKGAEGMHLAQNRDHWQDPVNMVMNLLHVVS